MIPSLSWLKANGNRCWQQTVNLKFGVKTAKGENLLFKPPTAFKKGGLRGI